MTEEEAVQIAEYVQAACPAQRFGEYTPDVWGEILAPYDVNEARAAVIAIARRQPFISPAEIVTEVKARREERIELAHVVYDGNPLETGAESIAARRALLRAAGDGLTEPSSISRALGTADHLALPPGPDHGPYEGRAAAARAAIGKMPSTRGSSSDPRSRPCRRCGAAPGASCTTGGRRRRDVHPIRLEDTRRTAAGLPLIDQAATEASIKAAAAAALAHIEDQEQEAEAS
ncbi:hypothetical protein [Streptomyces sp. SID161]|uniref:zinc finger domain-containing protein n=1 Tax=Streptomyces sp. SID161 TaxID=2690251 RepID=UPI00136D9FFE|nr:hypothetical protein [Streptomyces sp. SID161]MYW48848.1 hypothetical protein [Streptomyces sp. SID161]MYW49867.1 hypothetical protein [Streptomyces sp. SID161]